MSGALAAFFLLAAAAVQAPRFRGPPPPLPAVPQENKVEGTLPPMASAEAMAKTLVDGIVKDDVDVALPLFFPEAPFFALKDIPRSLDYHRQLVSWYVADVHSEHERLKNEPGLRFKSFRPGGCKWKAIKTEANKIPYWSCYSNTITLTRDKGAPMTLKVKAMINWGTAWYVTHLGPIPKG